MSRFLVFVVALILVSIVVGQDRKNELSFRISEGKEGSKAKPEPTPKPKVDRISDDAAKKLLDRLPAIKSEIDDEKVFAIREGSQPPPKTGATIKQSFPSNETSNKTDSSKAVPLEIVRYSPQGNVPFAPHLSVTFSQPMVAVSSVSDVAASDVPVKLTPQPKGKWRWIGTKTLLFEPDHRFPMATEYTAEIPAGVKSVTGSELAISTKWKFSTPPPQIISTFPADDKTAISFNPIIFIEFNQKIDKNQILNYLSLYPVTKLRLATVQEIESDKNIKQLVGEAPKDHWIAFRADAPSKANVLKAATKYEVTLAAGAKGGEGIRGSILPHSFSFHTAEPLAIKKYNCNYGLICRPDSFLEIQFNNPINKVFVDKTKIKIVPEVSNLEINTYHDELNISGDFKGRTTYSVTIDGSIEDNFNQTLGQSKTLTFKIEKALQRIVDFEENLAVLDPFGNKTFNVYSINHKRLKVSLYSVDVDDWTQFDTFQKDERRHKRNFGKLISSKMIPVNWKPDSKVKTVIDLKPALKNGLGHVVLIVDAVQPPEKESDKDHDYYYESRTVSVWIQSTNIALDTYFDKQYIMARTNLLLDGKPLKDVRVTLAMKNSVLALAHRDQTTNSDGFAKFPSQLLSETDESRNMIIARLGNDVSFVTESYNGWPGTNGESSQSKDELIWNVFTDRKIYRPSEEVHFKGLIRIKTKGPDGDITLPKEKINKVEYRIVDSRDNKLFEGSVDIDSMGGFDFKYTLPSTVNLGFAQMSYKAIGNGSYDNDDFTNAGAFRIEEFRRPDYETKVSATDGLLFISEPINLNVQALYFAGGRLIDSKVKWKIDTSETIYTPPNRDNFIFGKWNPWWKYDFYSYDHKSFESDYAGRTDKDGKHHLKIDFDSRDIAYPLAISASANVEDVNRQSISGIAHFIAHPSELYVGIRSTSAFVEKGQPVFIDSIVVDIDGNAKPDREFRITATLLESKYEDGEWKHIEKSTKQECIRKSANDPAQCKFDLIEGGAYRIVATVIDDKERRNQSEMTVWVAGDSDLMDKNLENENEEVLLISDQEKYKDGDTAKILVKAPFFPAEGLMTIRREGLVSTQSFTITDSSYTLKIPIKDKHVPTLHIQVDIAGVKTNKNLKAGKAPAFATGSLMLEILPLKRTLIVTSAEHEKFIEPGKEISFEIMLHDSDGKAVEKGDITFIVVDDAVYTMSASAIPNPIDIFYGELEDGVNHEFFREMIVSSNEIPVRQLLAGGISEIALNPYNPLGSPPAMALTSSMSLPELSGVLPIEDMMKYSPINLRLNFNPLATFATRVTTDADGRASVKFKLPDNLTRYRVIAVASAGENYFGIGESAITARLPLMVRPSAPRFLNFGDNFELPVVIQNQTDQLMKVDVAVRASNAILLGIGGGGDVTGQAVTAPANDRIEVRFLVSAKNPGTARFQIAGASGSFSDSAEVALPVWTPATTEAFATYGELDSGIMAQLIKTPSDAVKQFGGLDITTSSTQLQALTDAVIYLSSYPFDCAEQLSSRILAISSLRDVLAAFDAKGLPKPEELLAQVNRDLMRLKSLQRFDGGFGFWGGGGESWPYLTVHAAHAMLRAKERGFAVPSDMYEKSYEYLKNIDSKFPSTYDDETIRTIKAYSLYVRNRMGDNVTPQALMLITLAGGNDKLSSETLGWLLPVISNNNNAPTFTAEINRNLNNLVEETAGAAHFTSSYKDGGYLLLHSDRRTDGIILDSLIQTNPNSDLIPKIVRGLLANRKQGRWMNTQENAFILLALDKYFQTYEKATPDFIAKVWLGDTYAGGFDFKGRSVDSKEINVPMNWLVKQPARQNLVMSKEGGGRLYYRIGMNYAPENLQLKSADNGFTVTRTYEAIDDSNDARRDEDGTWRIKAGARIRVRLIMVNQARRYHVALVDPMPAGFEAVNPSLATSGPIPQDKKEQNSVMPYWYRTWFEHQNMRDERVEAFTSLLWEGVHTYSYVARATTPGVFIVPPSKAEEMYSPETFGRSSTDRVIIE